MPPPEATAGAFFLVGPTAVGKSAVAQQLAEEDGRALLSADSMLVYRGMDIGTAKPGAEERRRVPHGGLDLVAPDQLFSAGAWLAHARAFLRAARPAGRSVLVVGGTGLYVKCLTEGLRAAGAPDPNRRNAAEALLRDGGLAALQGAVRRRDPAAYAALADPQNPRRLVRACERAAAGAPGPGRWPGPPGAPLAGLRMDPRALAERIRARVERMYAAGLLDEVRRLRAAWPAWSRTAAQAIGYAEAADVLAGRCTPEAARERAALRTRQLAKRQMTWFRHQARVEWIEVDPAMAVGDIAARVRAVWQRHGPTPVAEE